MTRTKLLSILAAVAFAAPAAVRADDPGVFKVPGTDSTIKFYGYVQLDGTVDFSGRTTSIEDNDWATILPAVPADGSADAKKKPQTYLTARTSRFGIMTSTPSKYGNIGVRLEGDFNGPNGFQSETFTNSVLFRLRHAYGTIGGLLIGQTWTTFLDLGAAPDTVDFNGPGDLALVRSPMFRYTFSLAPGMSLALALENNRGQQYGSSPRFQTVPDIHANFTYAGGWGHISLRGVGQDYVRQVGTPGNESNKSKFSIAGAASGSVKLAGDTLVWQIAGGEGIGRYLLNAIGAGDGGTLGFADVVNDEIKLWTVYGYHLGFTHVWSPEFRSNLVWSQTFIKDPEIGGVVATNATQKDMMQAFVNTFWSMTKTTEFGLEYAYGQWKSFTGGGTEELKGKQNRITATFHYNFF